MLTDEGHKLTTAMLFDLLTGLSINHADKFLRLASLADRDDQATAHFQLRHQRIANAWSACGYQNCIVRTMRAPPERPIECLDRRVVNPEFAYPSLRFACEFADAFNRINLRSKSRQYCCLIAGAGADLQHSTLLINLKQLSHARDDERLRDPLSKINRQRVAIVLPP